MPAAWCPAFVKAAHGVTLFEGRTTGTFTEVAVLKVLGRQLAAAVVRRSGTAVAIGTIVGIPPGIVLGRFLWAAFVHESDVIPVPSVPALRVALVGVRGLVLVNVVTAVPGTTAAGAPTAALTRAE